MTKSKSSNVNPKDFQGDQSGLDPGFSKSHSMQEKVDVLRDQISGLSYEESLEKLDLLLIELRDEKIQIQDFQWHYISANIYLEHCQNLLNVIEQQVVEVDLNSFKESK